MKQVAVFGDSVSKGVIYDPELKRYVFGNGIDWKSIEERLNIKIDNHSKMGATITYGFQKLKAYLDTNPTVDIIVLEYGGNDSDFDWAKVAEIKSNDHQSKTTIDVYKQTLIQMIQLIESKNIKPIVLTLPAIHAKRYYKWISRLNINMKNVLYFLGDIEHIYRYHELYNLTILEVASQLNIQHIDIRKVFLDTKNNKLMICEDGIHPTIYAEQIIVEYIINQIDFRTMQASVVPQASKLNLAFYDKESII
ncbi:MAG: SGNH/GDSL hydrolase family protein [Acholeplasmataceae bacterium]